MLEDFLGPLQALGGSAGNGRLRELLTWEEATYEALKASLRASRRSASLWAVLPVASKALLAGVPAEHTLIVAELRNRRSGREIWRL